MTTAKRSWLSEDLLNLFLLLKSVFLIVRERLIYRFSDLFETRICSLYALWRNFIVEIFLEVAASLFNVVI